MMKAFTDSRGHLWGLTDHASTSAGSLRFSAAPERRHLWPIPRGWEIATPIELEAMLERVHPTEEGARPANR